MQIVAAAALVLAASWVIAAPAAARWQPPPGSYLQSCRDVRLHGDTLVAVCRTRKDRWVQSTLPRVNRCSGDIGNDNGRLICNYR